MERLKIGILRNAIDIPIPIIAAVVNIAQSRNIICSFLTKNPSRIWNENMLITCYYAYYSISVQVFWGK